MRAIRGSAGDAYMVRVGMRKLKCFCCHRRYKRGAVTVEAALVLPVLLCAFFSVLFVIKVVYAYGIIQYALNETASEIASAGYIYQISGIRDLHDTARNGLNDRAELLKGQVDSIFDAYDSLKDIRNNSAKGGTDTDESTESLQKAEDNFQKMLGNADNAARNPLQELKSIACYIASGAFNNVKTQVFIPVVRFTMKKYLVTQEIPDADQRLRILNVSGGLRGLDFSESSFLEDREENIDIIVKYRIEVPLPVRFLSAFEFRQRVRVKAWLGGDDPSEVLKGSNEADSIWSLNNFDRGTEIRKLFHANLPYSFPVIARFDGGKAVMIKSMDMTAVSYQSGGHAEKQLNTYLKELEQFGGLEKPWGSSKVVIRPGDIRLKELLLVIPQNKLSDVNERLLAKMAVKARARGITFTVERYGMKSEAKEVEGKTEESGTGGGNGTGSNDTNK